MPNRIPGPIRRYAATRGPVFGRIIKRVKPVGWVAAVLSVGLGGLAYYRDEFPHQRQPIYLGDLLGLIPSYMWVLGALVVVLVIGFEGAYLELTHVMDDAAGHVSTLESRLTPQIKVGDPFVTLDTLSHSQSGRLYVPVRNSGEGEMVKGCEAQVIRVIPDIGKHWQPAFYIAWSPRDGGQRSASFQTIANLEMGWVRDGDGNSFHLNPAGRDERVIPNLFGEGEILEMVFSAENSAPVRKFYRLTTEGHSYRRDDGSLVIVTGVAPTVTFTEITEADVYASAATSSA